MGKVAEIDTPNQRRRRRSELYELNQLEVNQSERRELCSTVLYTYLAKILLSLILDMACMDTPKQWEQLRTPYLYNWDSGEDSERGADNGTRGSAEMMRIYPLHAFETAAPARIRRLKRTNNM